jgi:hypothetical protein
MSDTKALVERLRRFCNGLTDEAADAIERLERELAAALAYKPDAERWRWFRANHGMPLDWTQERVMEGDPDTLTPEDYDAAIDAARKEGP